MKTKLLIGLGALALVLAAGTAWAMGPGRGHMMGRMFSHHITEMEDYIDATPQQRQVIEDAKNQIVTALQSRAKANHDAHQQLMSALLGDQVDEKALYAFADARANDIHELAQVIVPQIVKVHDALTPQQRAKLAERIKSRHQHHMQGGFGGPPNE